jgi:hypothetical protein
MLKETASTPAIAAAIRAQTSIGAIVRRSTAAIGDSYSVVGVADAGEHTVPSLPFFGYPDKMNLCNFLWSVLSSVVAAGFIWLIWWFRIRRAAGKYCGTWSAHDLVDRQLRPMPGNGTTKINRRMTLRRPSTWIHPGDLVYEGEHDGSPAEGRVRLMGDIRVNPVSLNQAVLTMRRDSGQVEYVIQEYHLMNNGDIYVVPATGGWNASLTPTHELKVIAEYNKHVLQRAK